MEPGLIISFGGILFLATVGFVIVFLLKRSIRKDHEQRGASASDMRVQQLLHDVSDRLPPGASVEEAIEQLLLLAKIKRRVEDPDSGRTPSHEDVGRR